MKEILVLHLYFLYLCNAFGEKRRIAESNMPARLKQEAESRKIVTNNIINFLTYYQLWEQFKLRK
jgi:hypothetical protein